jgi:rod shape-determining protein MreC
MNKRSSYFITFLFFIILTVLLIGLQRFSPVVYGFAMIENIFQPLQQFTYTVFASSSPSLTSEQKLHQQVVSLEQQVTQLKSDNNALRDQFSNTTDSQKNLLPAHIIGMPRFIPGISQPETIIIDQGLNQGVKNGTVVVIKNILVGKVTSVQPNLSVVSLITNSAISLTAMTLKTNALGIVQGKSNGKVDFENVILSDKLEVKDVVVTKGDMNAKGEGFPPQLMIGTITAVDKNPSALFQSAALQQPFDITHVSLVFLIPHR